MSDFKTVLVRDSTIGDITSDIDFAVKSGASQTTYQRFPSTSSSNSALIFNVQVPSENVVIGRDILISTGLTLTLTATGVPNGDYALNYGNQDALQAFPLNSLLTTATVQINNTTVSINLQDVLPSLLRMNNSRELYRYNSMTPSLPDQAYGVYADANLANNNPLAGYANASYDIDQTPRGAFPLKVISAVRTTAGGVVSNTLESSATTDTFVIVVSTVVTEPLFLSPFIFGEPEFNCQGLLGINNMSFTLNVDSTCKRVWSNGNGYITSVALGQNGQNGFTSPAIGTYGASSQPALLFRFLSTQPSDLIQTKNIVPYMDYPRYLTNSANQPQIDGWDYNAEPQPAPSSATLTSSNLQINQIPDLFIINVRIPMSQQTIHDPSEFLTINNISINLNNQSGLLSSSSQYDLWRLSVKNGSTQSWAEFSGQAWKHDATKASQGYNIPTTGSLLIINPAYDLSLPDYISCGSLGNYNFQFQCNVTNQLGQAVFPEIIVITANSGIFTTQQGVSAVYTGILTKEMVLSAKSSDQASAMTSMEVKRMVGGNTNNMPLTTMKAMRMMKMMPRTSGGVSSGGVSSGGASSGGRLRKMC
jgi:hypothetical protein